MTKRGIKSDNPVAERPFYRQCCHIRHIYVDILSTICQHLGNDYPNNQMLKNVNINMSNVTILCDKIVDKKPLRAIGLLPFVPRFCHI